jgi:hypothetical protein
LVGCEAGRLWLASFPGFLFLVFVNGNRIQILGFKDLSAIEAAEIIDAVAAVEELGSLVLTTLHSEITPILD